MAGEQRLGPRAAGVYQTLREEIASGTVSPGEDLSPGALARRFGVSGTTVRRALDALASDGVVRRHRGFAAACHGLPEETVRALRGSAAELQTIVRGAPIGISLATMDGYIVASNPAYRDMLGYTEDEMHGMHFKEFTHPEDVDSDLDLFQELVMGKRERYSMEKRCIRKDGSIIWTRLTVALVRDDEGRPRWDIGMMEDITEIKRAEAAMRELLEQRTSMLREMEFRALHDALTGLPNRALLRDRLNSGIHAAARYGESLALLFMDLNRFKEVNDTFGHHYGDALLQQLAERVQRALRGSDTVARLGGDEFAVVLPRTDETGAFQVAHKIRLAVADPFVVENHQFDVSTSVGIALYPEHGEDAVNLMRHADVAMYTAKRGGYSASVYSPDQDHHNPSHLTLARELREALDAVDLVLLYQPQLDLRAGRVGCMEALIRWRHPRDGILAPGIFVPLAEETGLIKPMTMWVLDEALRQQTAWRRAGLHVRVAVNVSARSLHDAELVEVVAELLARHGADASDLVVELTESAIIIDPSRVMHTLEQLHGMGVHLSMDDFGTGYSSLAFLKRMPIDEIKIDRSFVTDMLRNPDSASIVRSVIELGHNLGLSVVAEGVEDAPTFAALAGLTCDVIQGYFIGRPAAIEDVPALVGTVSRAHEIWHECRDLALDRRGAFRSA